MKRCSYCGRENAEDSHYCYECGTEFRHTAEARNPQAERAQSAEGPQYILPPLSDADRQKALVTLVSCRTLLAADVVVATLRSAGIKAFIPDEGLMQTYGLTTTFGYVRVQVSPNDYEEARALLSTPVPSPD